MTGRARMVMISAAIGLSSAVAPVTAVAADTCPPGQMEDATTPGFQCVPQCPSGTLVDAVTGVCVAAPGVPPPPLR
ncbi:MAG: hypothetical protein FGM25_05570 [Mycobacterium sp.]|nr:hypothetical protein [Mycobacterium sp.]